PRADDQRRAGSEDAARRGEGGSESRLDAVLDAREDGAAREGIPRFLVTAARHAHTFSPCVSRPSLRCSLSFFRWVPARQTRLQRPALRLGGAPCLLASTHCELLTRSRRW